MKKCPKCNKPFNDQLIYCPSCHSSLVVVEEIDIMPDEVLPAGMELPKTKEEIQKQLAEQNKIFNEQKTIQIYNVNDIPLTTSEKKVVSRELNKKTITRPTKKLKRNMFVTSLQTTGVLFLLILSIYIIKSSLTVQPSNSVKTFEKLTNTLTKEETLMGNWITNTDNLYMFKDNTFRWYNNYQVLNNNFYDGTYTYKQGLDALEEMGYTEDDYMVTFKKENIKLDNIYSIQLDITNEFINNISKSNNKKWWIIMILSNNKEATIYNKTLDLRYHLIKK